MARGRWVGRHWRIFAGAALLLEPAWRGLRWLVTAGGDVDFIAGLYQAPPVWMRAMMDWILNPPSWSIIPAILAGFALIYWGFRRTGNNPDRMSIPVGWRHARLVSAARAKGTIAFDYSTNNGKIEVGAEPAVFAVRFSKLATEASMFTWMA